ncbi:MAG: arylesterase [Gammaproteobacteria bacterium]|nr:MAG: arylesterase [Gammaproteobacteria bacterium]
MKINVLAILLLVFALFTCSDSSKNLSPLSSDATILAFGDSLTYGTGANKGEDYPALLSKLANITVINAGVPGEISSKGLERLPKILDEHKPDLLILIHGGNDILKKLSRIEQKSNLSAMIESAKTRNIEVAMLGVPEPGIFLKSSELYEEIANETNIPIELSLLPDILGDNSLKSDFAHPNADGYQLLAEGIFEFLEDYDAL